MESELNELVQAWKTCMDGSIRDQNIRQKAFNYIENFKQTSPSILDIGFYLAYQKDSFELSHFGLQLITHTIKFKWNDFNDQMKAEIKNRLMNIIINIDDNQNIKGPSYLKNSMCLVIIELIKREWPQNWPNLINDLFEISNKSIEHKKLIFIILKYISEEFIDADSTQTINIPTQRRKDINQYLNQYMENIFYFYLDCLEYCYDLINKNDSINLNEILELANTCLDSFSNYITWININLILSRNYSIINISLNLLSHEKLCINSSKCLIGLSNRKGTADERKPLLGMFSDAVLSQLMNCIKLSIQNTNFSELLKYLVQILVAMGSQLNFLWTSNNFEKPTNFAIYLNAAYEFLINENKLYSFESIQLWNALLQNEFIQTDNDIQQYVILISQALTNSYILFKFTYSSMIESFDTEEEFNKFLQKYRTELSRLIRNACNLNIETYFTNSYEWTMKIVSETKLLSESDESGYDQNSFLYQCWDAVIFLWTSINQTLSKKFKTTDLSIKPKLIELLHTAIQFKSINPNYTSFNYSFISSILNLTCEHSDFQTRELIVKTVFEKLYTDIILFKSETVKYLSSSLKTKYYLNLRRQLTAILLTNCKNFSKILYNSFEFIFKSLLEIINSNDTTQMEKGILVQALVHLSNESETNQLQLSLVNHFLIPIQEYFQARKLELTNIESFIKLIGLNESNSQTGLENRKLIFYFINCLYGFLKCIELKKNQNNTQISSIFINIFESLIYLLKSFNQLHSIASINKEYLDMTENCKNIILGMHQEKHGKNHISLTSTTDSTIDQADKILMFMYNTYDTLNQLIGLYMTKFKQELLLIDLSINQAYADFMYKFADALFTSFNQLPNFRIRYLIRYVLKSCLTSINFDKELIEVNKNSFILKLNELLMEYFLPSILSRISESNKLFSNKIQDNIENLNKELQHQIIEENQFTLMCRDLIDLIRNFFSFSQTGEGKGEETIEEEQNEMLMENVLAKDGQTSSQISELAIYLLKTNKIIYQSIILCLFDGLNWPDSYCCARILRLAQSLIDNYSIVDQPSDQFSLFLNFQISEKIFTCCLTGLQLHGEHQEIASLLTNLVYSIYEKSPISYRQLYNNVLGQIPNLNTKIYDEFLIKFDKVTGEKIKKDLFKKIIQPVVGKNIGQLHKYDIQIRVLEPLNLNYKKFLSTDGTNGAETNICSLFDPNN